MDCYICKFFFVVTPSKQQHQIVFFSQSLSTDFNHVFRINTIFDTFFLMICFEVLSSIQMTRYIIHVDVISRALK